MISRGIEILKEDGIEEFFIKSTNFLERKVNSAESWIKSKVYSVSFFDAAAFRISKKRLVEQEPNNSPENILSALQKYRGVGYYSSIEPAQVDEEFKELLELVKEENPEVVMEIGTMDGGTLYGWTNVSTPDLAISLDLPEGKFGGGYPEEKGKLYREFSEKTNFELVRANSHDPSTKENIKELLEDRKIDFLFIDGDHTYEGVKQDFEMYSDLVRDGGVIAFHDICDHPNNPDCNVDRFWKEISQKYESRELIKDSDQGWAGIGIIWYE
jgi:predicted O-methyltransferase YrrM